MPRGSHRGARRPEGPYARRKESPMEYPITLARDTNGTVLVSFVDFPEAHTFGEDVPDALRRAPDALATVIDAYIKDRRDLPLPSTVVTQYRVRVPALIEAKMR